MLKRSVSFLPTDQISTAETLSQKQGTLIKIRDQNLVQYLASDINTKRADIILIICAFVSGLVDGVSFTAWGSFASMQTGNSVFIALGASGQPQYPDYLWAKSLISVATFVISNIFFSRFMRFLGPRRRVTNIICFLLQSLALLVAALLVHVHVVSPRAENPRAPIAWMQVLPISLLAFQAAGQIVASRTLGYDEIPTVVLTTLLCDLLIDQRLFAADNPKRNRRVACFVTLILGAMTAGGLYSLTNVSASLWLAFALKGGITLCWAFWESSPKMQDDEQGQV
ncbi:hypothetical protein TMatcc_005275 [Talaromyces marneffei ATCC 18224]|uniref:DUF1275 domain protein n=1 Tax=Talaromyces marneffei (strain ATCC 18224 / CBS 334.59 / QM 7333) TaxID=441960 RepID=B6QBL3_TALMQ|nr:uncharacterized protein EYB26_006162 [Talaromyces marneffei]EEA26454.1 DUF1275 domain protein [Talaromyces marneffei ATCC 18224]KAE8555142.1 hypothetical protein EYB25_003690 [Talaromyces marneffei]QGA18477.1 hypothetical protein EYB26_006162 [Talaromyces marneffei]